MSVFHKSDSLLGFQPYDVTNLIHVARDGRSLGRFDAQEVAEGLLTGRFLATDLGWYDPMPLWLPLSQIEGMPAARTPPKLEELPPPQVEPAWERRGEVGIPTAAAETVSVALGKPREFFATMRTEGGFRTPLLFHVMLGTLTGWVALGYQYAIYRVNPGGLGEIVAEAGPGFVGTVFGVFAALLPLGVAVSSFISAGAFHACLKLFSASDVRFEATFRVYCYAWGAASVFQLVPVCGAYMFPAFAVYLTVIGLKSAHRANPWASVFAVLVPVLVCYGVMAASLAFSGVGLK